MDPYHALAGHTAEISRHLAGSSYVCWCQLQQLSPRGKWQQLLGPCTFRQAAAGPAVYLFQSLRGAGLHQRQQPWQQRLAAFQAKALAGRELAGQELLKAMGSQQPAQHLHTHTNPAHPRTPTAVDAKFGM